MTGRLFDLVVRALAPHVARLAAWALPEPCYAPDFTYRPERP